MSRFTAVPIILAALLAGAQTAAVSAQGAAAPSSSMTAVLPAPTGTYGVGVVAHAVTDPGRREIFTVDSSDCRRFPVSGQEISARRRAGK